MKVYINPVDFKCHTTNPDGTYLECKNPFFDGKCTTFIEGYRFVPFGYSWTRSDGQIFRGEMIAPWADYILLEIAQLQYELDLAEAAAAYQKGVDGV